MEVILNDVINFTMPCRRPLPTDIEQRLADPGRFVPWGWSSILGQATVCEKQSPTPHKLTRSLQLLRPHPPSRILKLTNNEQSP